MMVWNYGAYVVVCVCVCGIRWKSPGWLSKQIYLFQLNAHKFINSPNKRKKWLTLTQVEWRRKINVYRNCLALFIKSHKYKWRKKNLFWIVVLWVCQTIQALRTQTGPANLITIPLISRCFTLYSIIFPVVFGNISIYDFLFHFYFHGLCRNFSAMHKQNVFFYCAM